MSNEEAWRIVMMQVWIGIGLLSSFFAAPIFLTLSIDFKTLKLKNDGFAQWAWLYWSLLWTAHLIFKDTP